MLTKKPGRREEAEPGSMSDADRTAAEPKATGQTKQARSWRDVLRIHPAAEPAHFRARRTFRIDSWRDVEALPLLPDRVQVRDFKMCGVCAALTTPTNPKRP